jgi:putative ABC transport system permease protein
LNSYTFHINLYDLVFLGTIFIGLIFTLLLWFTKRINRTANRFLGMALATIVLWMAWILGIDIRLGTYFPKWSWLPLQFSLTFGSLIFFYVRKITQPQRKFSRKDLLHFSPLLLEQGVLVLQIKESIRTGAATYDTQAFQQFSPVLQLLALISVITYLFWSNRLIRGFHQQLKDNVSDQYLYELCRLQRLLVVFGLLWLLWIPYTAADYFFYNYQLGIHAYYPLYLLLAGAIIWIAMEAFLQPEVIRLQIPEPARTVSKPLPSTELLQKGHWLRQAMEAHLYYQDTELSLRSLAEKLHIHPHELSRIINTMLGKNFNDFVNEYRIGEVTRKMHDPAFDRMNLLGIAMDSGFNSKTTFNRTFRQMTGKSPAEYKRGLKKERPTYHLEPFFRPVAIISCHEATPVLSFEKLNRNYMFSNYLKIAWRNLITNKIYSGLNILGLAVGMTVALIIGLWMFNEYSYDRFLPNYESLYQVKRNFTNNGEIGTVTSSSLALADRLRMDIPEIENVAETDYFNAHGLMVGDKKLYMNGAQAGSDFLKMFQFPLLRGDAAQVLKDPFSIVLTESTANALFGSDDVIGKTVRVDNLNNLKVTGILKDTPSNSSLQFAYVIPFSYYEIADPSVKAGRSIGFNQNSFQIFVKLRPGIAYVQVEPKIRGLEKKYLTGANTDIAMQPLKDWHLYTDYKNGKAVGGFVDYVHIFSIIGMLVLLIACINFINLTTARSEKRAREVGVRKTMGSNRRDLIFQFLTESVFTTFMAFLFCLLFTWLALPAFNTLIKGQIAIPFSSPGFWLLVTGAVLVTGLLAGSKSAFYLSSFNPVKVLKGMKTGKSAAFSRKALVVLQFSCSVALIISTIIIYRQVQYAKDRPIGYNLSLLMQTNQNSDLGNHYEALKNDLLSSGFVRDVANASSPATGIWWHTGISWPGQLPGESINIGTVKVSPGYFKTLGIQLSEGRDFTGEQGADSLSVVLNEAAVKRLRLNQPLNQSITWNNNKLRIVGVVKNALMESPYAAAEPMMFMSGGGSFLLYRLSPNVSTAQAIAKLTTIFNTYNPAFPYSYQFTDQKYAAKFSLELLIGKLAGIFAGLAIFISCLGLFGLAAFVAEQRNKEIGVRKVLGATVTQLWFMLSKDFLVLVGISCLLATPVAWYFLQNWLQKYSYRITMGPGIFMLAALMVMLVTLATISFQAIKAALTNPVKSLRSE